jgi:phenylpropionate dioxygenase-like ring-hydroxylating dioxygenase large terminal subunit
MGADLANGAIVGDAIQCSFHNWEFGPDGRCVRIPAQKEIPPQARQTCYPTVERHGFVFIFLAERPSFPLPFFADCDPNDFRPAPLFRIILDCPWYLVGANGFDLQHLHAAHERVLVRPLVGDCPAPFARRSVGTSRVAGDSLQDRLTRMLTGDTVTMTVTDWCGNLIFVTAQFRRSCSYGMVATEPLGPNKVLVTNVVFVPRSKGLVARALLDPIHARIRRLFIKAFLKDDARRLEGMRYDPKNLIECDRFLCDYFVWLAATSNGVPGRLDEAAASRPVPVAAGES